MIRVEGGAPLPNFGCEANPSEAYLSATFLLFKSGHLLQAKDLIKKNYYQNIFIELDKYEQDCRQGILCTHGATFYRYFRIYFSLSKSILYVHTCDPSSIGEYPRMTSSRYQNFQLKILIIIPCLTSL